MQVGYKEGNDEGWALGCELGERDGRFEGFDVG